ncbi:ADP-ribosyltransferase domain-containing protein [Streptomyces roseus]|uniref:ADP-ribosyltransferase domain-containing protein n=1 Tax=Streptomyces roseus TaxID=66430 RepID=UPI00099C86FE|nr:ADP-ribosyltransferase domain-containing protein [Streptomyces roseus]
MTESSALPVLRVVLTDVNERVVEAWRAAFADTPGIEIRRGSILDEDVDAWVTPTNSRGRMDGGVDAAVKRRLGPGIQLRVQRAIRDRFAGSMPVGSAVCVPSGAAVPRFLISTPTMVESSQNVSATLNVALACAAAFQAVHRQNREAPGSIRSVALVGMGAQTGRVPARVCANLMWTGYTLFQDHWFEQDDELRATITAQLSGIEERPVEERVRIVAPKPAADALALAELFEGGGEPWLPLLKPVIEAQPDAARFIGKGRDPEVVPVRELTFQALKPHPPHRWKVVVFGQNPYPRPESATGIAMFDNTFNDWKDSQFGRVVSIRCIIKAAAMWKYGVARKTPIAEIRALLKERGTVQPPEWFQAMLTQGVLLLNASLTASGDGAMGADRHTAFWRPVAERIVEEILKAKQGAEEEDRGVVFAWWGAHARALKKVVLRLQEKYPDVEVRHIDHVNPAAQGDVFCEGDHFAMVNEALASLGCEGIDWLPSKGWNEGAAAGAGGAGGADGGVAARMGAFIESTMNLHQLYLERLSSVKDEGLVLPAITGVFATPLMGFQDAVAPVTETLSGLAGHIDRSRDFGERRADGASGGGLSADAIAALHLYTRESAFYREINAVLRSPDRSRVTPYLPYLRLLFSAVSGLPARTEPLWRGVSLDLRSQYPVGRTVTWWGVSSCTSELSVARSFLGNRGKRTLFEVTPARAVGIKSFSAFTGEEEYILAPGTQLKVTDVKSERGGLCTVRLTEADLDPVLS